MSEHGMTRREMMVGLGAGAGAALALPSLTAVAAPITNHVPAWAGGYYQALGPTVAGLTYVNYDATAFHPYNYGSLAGGSRGIEIATGAYLVNKPGWLAAPLSLPVGSVIRQINLSYYDQPIVSIFKRDFVTNPKSWVQLFSESFPLVTGNPGTHTYNLATPVVIEQTASYSLQIYSASMSAVDIYGATVGYLPPTAGFVPFSDPAPRVYDSRTGDGKLGFQQERTINLGNPGVRGALFNLTVTETEGSGFVAAFAGNVAYPGNSSINYFGANQNLANGVVCAVDGESRIKIRGGGPAGKAQVIIDRLGWFV